MTIVEDCGVVSIVSKPTEYCLIIYYQENKIWVVKFDPANIGPNMPWIKLYDDFTTENEL